MSKMDHGGRFKGNFPGNEVGIPHGLGDVLTLCSFETTDLTLQSSTMWLFWVVACLTLQPANTEKMSRTRHVNPQGFMNISEIIHYWGYPSEQYEVLTADGYYLLVNRIPYGVHGSRKTEPGPAVLVVSGFGVEGRSWIANLPSNSLAFVLADNGYDVWLLNCRGSTWSRRHQNLSIDQEQFWDFSFHEMGIYDVPATINFILQKTKQDALYYVGHSQGATAGLIAFSDLPQVAQKVKLFFSLSPAYTTVGVKGSFEMLLSLSEDVAKVSTSHTMLLLYQCIIPIFFSLH
ncbi:hypothetical protein lerEdw1_020901 [Lerista edwardsae]|nr:hypothetical protein lerEdw1_020901 [Lerista edwardsae]